jgi:small conductance mechanosensitive channel
MILVLKPFKLGDEIKALGEQGTVNEIQIFNTYLITPDNKVVIFPNGPLANGNIVNFTKEKTRRLEWRFIFTHDASFHEVKEIISGILLENKRILAKDPTVVGLDQITGMHVTVRAWVKTADFAQVLFDVNAAAALSFSQANIPFAKS